jgi:hypothetical protein
MTHKRRRAQVINASYVNNVPELPGKQLNSTAERRRSEENLREGMVDKAGELAAPGQWK